MGHYPRDFQLVLCNILLFIQNIIYFFSFIFIFSKIINIKEIKKQTNDAKKRILVKNDIAITTPLKAKAPSIIATSKNKMAQNNNIFIPLKILISTHFLFFI